ncbi:Lrp/AsnC family transcriptional regulator [Burkholderia cenocepacia]|uniref:Lrp/AsnC family transcriptional regulator n=1 Tax=Burkholderia cenocepacia TaxID=95486 RepID=UPI00404234CA
MRFLRKNGRSALKISAAMDDLDWKVVTLLQANGRISYTELARQVHLSVPAVTERVKRLEAAGVIEGYTARINPAAAGYPVSALIGITVPQPAKAKFLRLLETIPEVVECHHVTGADSYMMRLAAISMTHLEQLIERINLYGETRTSIVMSTPLPARGLARPPSQRDVVRD